MMNWRRTCLLWMLLTALGACGDDSGDTDHAADDAGGLAGDGDGDGGDDGPSPTRPDASTTGSTDGGSPQGATAAQCHEEIVAEGSALCLDCLCDECPKQAVECDEECWRTVRCILSSCAGDGTDSACIAQRCSQDLAGAGGAMSLGRCINTCASSCTVAIDSAIDAGSDQDGGA